MTTSIFNGTAEDEIGADNSGTDANLNARILWSQVKDGIDGNIVDFFDVRTVPEGTTSFSDSKGNTWNLQGNAEVVAHVTRTVKIKQPSQRRSNIVEYDNDGAHMPTTGFAIIGEGEGNDGKLFFIQQTLGNIPLWEGKLTLKDQGNDDLLIERGNFCLANGADVNRQYTIELDHNLAPFHNDFSAGDYVRIVINDKFTQEDALFWVGRKRVTLSKQQDEKITVEVTQ